MLGVIAFKLLYLATSLNMDIKIRVGYFDIEQDLYVAHLYLKQQIGKILFIIKINNLLIGVFFLKTFVYYRLFIKCGLNMFIITNTTNTKQKTIRLSYVFTQFYSYGIPSFFISQTELTGIMYTIFKHRNGHEIFLWMFLYFLVIVLTCGCDNLVYGTVCRTNDKHTAITIL